MAEIRKNVKNIFIKADLDVSKAKHDACIGALEGVRSSGFRDVLALKF